MLHSVWKFITSVLNHLHMIGYLDTHLISHFHLLMHLFSIYFYFWKKGKTQAIYFEIVGVKMT